MSYNVHSISVGMIIKLFIPLQNVFFWLEAILLFQSSPARFPTKIVRGMNNLYFSCIPQRHKTSWISSIVYCYFCCSNELRMPCGLTICQFRRDTGPQNHRPSTMLTNGHFWCFYILPTVSFLTTLLTLHSRKIIFSHHRKVIALVNPV